MIFKFYILFCIFLVFLQRTCIISVMGFGVVCLFLSNIPLFVLTFEIAFILADLIPNILTEIVPS